MTREEELQKIKDNSPYSLPDNPSESGWTAGQIKEKFWKGLFVLYDIINADRDELQTKLEQIDDAIDDFAGIAGVVAKARGDEDGVNLKQNYAKTAALVDGTIACLKYIKENGESGNIKDIEAAVTSVRTSLDAFIADKFTGEKAKKAIQADSAEIATKDVDGNPIKTTYAKQSSLDALLSMITAIGNGSSTVDKARKDQDGNRIDLTYIKKSNIVNDLNHDDVNLPLSAKQGKVLKEIAQGFISSTGDNTFGGDNSFTGANTFSGVLNPNSNGKGLVMPDTSGYSADKTIATADKFDDYRTSAAQDVIDQATRDIAEGKTKAFSVDPTTTGNEALQSDNKTITLTSFEDVDGNTITVSELNKGDEIFTVNGVNATYKDRWLMNPANGTWGLLDADLPDLTNAASLSGNNTFTGDNTFSGKLNKNGSGYGFTLPSSASLEANSEIVDTASAQTITGKKVFNDIQIAGAIKDSNNTTRIIVNAGGVTVNSGIAPNGERDLGTSSNKWKNLYLSGQFKDGNNATYGLILPDSTNWTANKTIAIAENTVDLDSAQTITGVKTFSSGIDLNNNVKIGSDSSDRFVIKTGTSGNEKLKIGSGESLFATRLSPDTNYTYDLGRTGLKWKDLYLAGKIKDGTNEASLPEMINDYIVLKDHTNFSAITGDEAYKMRNGGFIPNCAPINGTQRNGIFMQLATPIAGNQYKAVGWFLDASRNMYIFEGSISGVVEDSTSNITYSNFTEKKLIDLGNEEGNLNVINASDIVNITLTQAQYDLITNGKPTLIKGTYLGFKNILITYWNEYSTTWRALAISEGIVFSMMLNTNSKALTEGGTDIGLNKVARFNEKAVPSYPSSPTASQLLGYKPNNTLAYLTKLFENASGYGLTPPDTSSWTADKTLATTEDVGQKMSNPMTTAGDIIVGGSSGTPTRLAKGTAGQVLKVNANADGVEWGNQPHLYRHIITVGKADTKASLCFDLINSDSIRYQGFFDMIFDAPASGVIKVGGVERCVTSVHRWFNSNQNRYIVGVHYYSSDSTYGGASVQTVDFDSLDSSDSPNWYIDDTVVQLL